MDAVNIKPDPNVINIGEPNSDRLPRPTISVNESSVLKNDQSSQETASLLDHPTNSVIKARYSTAHRSYVSKRNLLRHAIRLFGFWGCMTSIVVSLTVVSVLIMSTVKSAQPCNSAGCLLLDIFCCILSFGHSLLYLSSCLYRSSTSKVVEANINIHFLVTGIGIVQAIFGHPNGFPYQTLFAIPLTLYCIAGFKDKSTSPL